MKIPALLAMTATLLMINAISIADEAKRKAAKEAESAAADVYIKIPDIKGETSRSVDPDNSAEMNKGEIISEIASEPVSPPKPAKKARLAVPVSPKAVAAPTQPQADGDDNTNTKSGGINTIAADCTLEEKLKDNKICKKD